MQQVLKTCFVYTILFAKISFFKIGKGTVIRNGVFDQSILSWVTYMHIYMDFSTCLVEVSALGVIGEYAKCTPGVFLKEPLA